MNNILAFFIFSFLSGVVLGGWCDRDDWYGKRHFAIADKINNIRRRDYGLPALECHWSLVQTATAHSKNQQDVPTPDASECNPHSWLSKNHLGKKGVTCCFPRDGDGCMWNKPEEIAGRNAIGGGDGYEITLGPSNGDMTADEAIKAWSKSARHKVVFTAQGKWKKWNLTKIGCFYIGNWANCWFSA